MFSKRSFVLLFLDNKRKLFQSVVATILVQSVVARTITNSLQEKCTDNMLRQFIVGQIISCRDKDAAEAIFSYIRRNRL